MSSNLKVNTILPSTGTTVTVSGISSVTGSISAGSSITGTTFYGSGANLTSLPAANLTGTLPAISGANLTGVLSDIVEDTSPQLGGNLDCNNKNISLNDSTGGTNNRIKIGTNDDLQLWHNSSTGNSNISNYNGDLYIQGNNGSGTGVNQIAIKSNAAVELNYQGTKKFETATEGVVIPSGGGNCLRVFGQNTAHATSALVIGQNSTTVSQLRAYGPDTSTNGQINFRTSRSNGLNSVNLTYNGNLQFDSGYGIDFSAASGSASGSASALLDDYEEGVWTATLSGNSSPTNTATNNPTTTRSVTGTYRKIGSLVHVQALWTGLQSGGGANDMHNHQLQHITGIPFTSGNASGTSVFTAPLGYSRGIYGRYNNSIIEECVLYFWLGTASTTVYLQASQIVQNSPGTLFHTVSNSSSSMYYAFNMTYHTN